MLQSETNDLHRAEDDFLVTSRTFVAAWRRELDEEERTRLEAEKAKRAVTHGN